MDLREEDRTAKCTAVRKLAPGNRLQRISYLSDDMAVSFKGKIWGNSPDSSAIQTDVRF